MNERIKELYIQAAEQAMKEEPTDLLAGQLIQMEKFAELIVRECAKIAFQNDIAKFTRDGYRIGLDIQKHFGVEE